MNFFVVRQGWTNARTKAVAARKACSMPGRLSSIPTTAAVIASKPQIARRISVIVLLCGVEKALVMIVLFDSRFCYGCPTVCVTGAGAGVDSVWEQEKLEARKMLENAAESPASSARFVRRFSFLMDHQSSKKLFLQLRLLQPAQSRIRW